ncbi:hypothetical protein CYMTET_35611 [Cymbomonas tetramitiformis]|uniref:Uncharacterized protein n=1 Tax=Cymbomonas tetramitiformis TaxID=36881 RepID=A0AAE0KNM7_9CHLO|nr:hypothetical protein CYMTET_35611 [Cymbomonas tetramitiformis]
MCTFLRPADPEKTGGSYQIEIPSGQMESTVLDYHSHGGCVHFDANLQYVGSTFGASSTNPTDDQKTFQRIVSSFMTWSTWSVHLGIVHALVADDWNHHFARTIGSCHALSAVVQPLMLGTAESINLGCMLLANNAPGAIPAIVSNLTPNSIERLMKTHYSDVSAIIHFPTIYENTGRANTPMLETLKLWWDILYKFVDSYVHDVYSESTSKRSIENDLEVVAFMKALQPSISVEVTAEELAKVITMMHFNNVIHQTYSNCQHTNDVIKLKQSWVCHKTHEYPSAHVQDRLVDLLVGTSGESITYDRLTNIWCEKHNDNHIFQALREAMHKLSECINNDGDKYISYLSPNKVACSITW